AVRGLQSLSSPHPRPTADYWAPTGELSHNSLAPERICERRCTGHREPGRGRNRADIAASISGNISPRFARLLPLAPDIPWRSKPTDSWGRDPQRVSRSELTTAS